MSFRHSYRRVFISSVGGVSEGGTGGSPSDLRLGYPTDGTWNDGLLPFQAGDKIDDALDGINEVLSALAPTPPPYLNQAYLTFSPTPVQGKVPNGLSSNWPLPGTTVSVINSSNLSISISEFGPGDKGLVKVECNHVINGLLDIDINFREVDRPGIQDLTYWDNQGVGSLVTNGVVNFTGGHLQVIQCGIYNEFKKWQAIDLSVVITALLVEGLNSFDFFHTFDSEKHLSASIYYDNDTTSLSFSQIPTVVEHTPVFSWLSGIRYYGPSSTFDIHYIGLNCFRKTYHPTQVSQYSLPGASSVTKNPSTVPQYTDQFGISDLLALTLSNVMSIDARLSAVLRDPFGNTSTATSASESRLINTYTQVSTDKREYFRDEVYRLQDGSYTSVPSSITNQWNSQTSLVNGQAQCFNSQLVCPSINFSSGYLPVQLSGRNYSLLTGDAVYLRAFRDANVPHSSVIITAPGSEVSVAGSGLNMFIKLPGATGWMDVGSMFSPATFTGADNDGCLVSVSGNDHSITFGTFSTDMSGWMIVVKIILRGSTYLGSLVTNW